MKRKFICWGTMALLMTLFACKKENSLEKNFEGKSVELNVSVHTGQTKASVIGAETDINKLDVLVFNRASGLLEAHASAVSSSSLSMTCTTGDKTIVALANSNLNLASVASLSQLKQLKSNLLDNNSSAFIMEGASDKTISSSASVEIELRRIVSKVQILAVENALSLAQYSSEPITIKSIYLINLVGDKPVLGNYTASDPIAQWQNFRTNQLSSNTMISDLVNETISHEQTREKNHIFYCLPNPVVNDTDADDTANRHTRLVVEAQIGESVYYYPITLPIVEQNKIYTISKLKITQLGYSQADEKDSATQSMEFTVVVKDWEETISMNDYII